MLYNCTIVQFIKPRHQNALQALRGKAERTFRAISGEDSWNINDAYHFYREVKPRPVPMIGPNGFISFCSEARNGMSLDPPRTLRNMRPNSFNSRLGL